MDATILVITIVSILVVFSAITTYISQYIRIPYTIMLVLAGYGLSHLARFAPGPLSSIFLNYRIDPNIILFAFLPTLIFESAFGMDVKLFRRNLMPVLTLAIPGLFLSTIIIGGMVWALTPLGLMVCLLLGAILSATDPVAVISLFKQLGVPKRLTILVEGESLLNDSTAIVTAKTILFMMSAAAISSATFYHGAVEFVVEFFGGIAVGFVMSLITGWILAVFEDNAIISLSMTVVLAYLSFLLADKIFGVSGVMATITAGIMMAGWGRTKMTDETENQLHHLLAFLSYVVNSMIFLLVGLSVSLTALSSAVYVIFVTIAAMVVSRAVVIYGMIPMIGKIPGAEPIDYRYQTIMWWGGLRGAIALAIVLGLSGMPDQSLLEAVVMGAVIFTILFQGLSIHHLIHWLGLDKPLLIDRFIQQEATLMADKAAVDKIPVLQRTGLFSQNIARYLMQRENRDISVLKTSLDNMKKHELIKTEQKRLLFLQCYSVEKNLYYEMFHRGHLSEQSYRVLNQHIDLKIDLMRYRLMETEKISKACLMRILNWSSDVLAQIPLLRTISEKLRIWQMIGEYEEVWGRHQACAEVLACLDELAKIEEYRHDLVNEVKHHFTEWLNQTKAYLDEVAEQFPEFVTDMQRRLGERMMTYTKWETIAKEIQKGLVPGGLMDEQLGAYRDAIKKLRKWHPEKLKLDPHGLIANVPFLHHIPKVEIEAVIQSLEEVHVPSGKLIVNEGKVENAMYFILRGVVRVVKQVQGVNRDVATLLAGDYFGEMALLFDQPRSASCVSVTPCLLFSLNKDRFLRIMNQHPDLLAEMINEAEKRATALQTPDKF